MDKKVVEDKVLFLMQSELRCRKATRTILRERITHEDLLIIDLERKILEYINQEGEFKKDIKGNID